MTPEQRAMKVFNDGVQELQTTKEVSLYCQMLCTVAGMTIAGIDGQKFKNGFFQGAIDSEQTITTERVN